VGDQRLTSNHQRYWGFVVVVVVVEFDCGAGAVVVVVELDCGVAGVVVVVVESVVVF
jgi:hypothetical protein